MRWRRRSWLWTFLFSREGAWSLLATVAGALTLGLLPDLVQALPVVGDSPLWLVFVALVAVLATAWATHALRTKEGVGIVMYLGLNPDWDRTRLDMMRQDARRRHATCFVVDPQSLLRGVEVSDIPLFAYRVMQAGIAETANDGIGPPESVSFYLAAKQQHAYALGKLVRTQLHQDVRVLSRPRGEEDDAPNAAGFRRIDARLMGHSEERGRTEFVAIRLDSELKRAPDENDRRRLREVVRDLEPEVEELRGPDEQDGGEQRLALIVAAGHNIGMAEMAREAAREGVSDTYVFPGQGGPEDRRCSAALVIETYEGNIPDRMEYHEAFVRHVVHHWRRAVEERGPKKECWLFVDGPAALVMALGALLGRNCTVVPFEPRGSGAAGAGRTAPRREGDS